MNQNKSSEINPVVISVGLLILICGIGIASGIQLTDKQLIPLSTLALLAGVLFEAKRIFEKWRSLLGNLVFSLLISLTSFIPGKNETAYHFEKHFEIWPYAFILIFITCVAVDKKKKTTAKLTEGITLLQSIAFLYWVFDHQFFGTTNSLLVVLMVIGLMFSAFSLINAFSFIDLSRTNRLTLSIWSCIIMVLFAVDNIYQAFHFDQTEAANGNPYGILTGLRFFLLGICSIYMAQNYYMLVMFLPGRGTFFNAQYF